MEVKKDELARVAEIGAKASNGWDYLILDDQGYWVDGGMSIYQRQGSFPFHGIVLLSRFSSAVRQLKGSMVELESKGRKLVMKSGKQRFSLPFIDDETLYNRLKIHKKNLSALDGARILPESWIDGIEAALSLGKSAVAGPYFDGKNILATDSIHIFQQVLEEETPVFWLAPKEAKLASAMSDPDTQVVLDNTMAWFKGEEETVGVLQLSGGNYPKEQLQGILDKAETAPSLFSLEVSDELIEMAQSAEAVAQDADGMTVLELSITGKDVQLSASADSGSYEGTAELKKEAEKDIRLTMSSRSLTMNGGRVMELRDLGGQYSLSYRDDGVLFLAALQECEVG